MHHRTEHEIMKSWNKDLDQPIVSVCCTTYNHELYIAEAINGFLMQETDFPFEILIRDDCSTDKTASIVKEYADKYPSLIKPVFEKENMYSKGVKPMPELYKIVQGKYIALCEGDDYWTDPLKLQKQVGFLEDNKRVSLSFHYSSLLNFDNSKNDFFRNKIDAYFTTEDIIGPWFIPTQSIMFKRSCIAAFIQVYGNIDIANGDLALQLICSTQGKISYMDENMSVYRLHAGGVSQQLTKYPMRSYRKMKLLYDTFDNYTNQKYSILIEDEIQRVFEEHKGACQHQIRLERRKKYPYIFKMLSKSKKILLSTIWRKNG